LDDNPSGTPSDTYTISVIVSDESSTSNALATSIVVDNLAPAFVGLTLSAATITEGASLTLSGGVADTGSPDVLSVTVNWGDGSGIQTPALSPTKTFTANHLYSVPGSYTVTTVVTDDDGGSTVDIRLLVVADLAPSITPAAFGNVSEGSVFTA